MGVELGIMIVALVIAGAAWAIALSAKSTARSVAERASYAERTAINVRGEWQQPRWQLAKAVERSNLACQKVGRLRKRVRSLEGVDAQGRELTLESLSRDIDELAVKVEDIEEGGPLTDQSVGGLRRGVEMLEARFRFLDDERQAMDGRQSVLSERVECIERELSGSHGLAFDRTAPGLDGTAQSLSEGEVAGWNSAALASKPGPMPVTSIDGDLVLAKDAGEAEPITEAGIRAWCEEVDGASSADFARSRLLFLLDRLDLGVDLLRRVQIHGGAGTWTQGEMRDWCCDYASFINGSGASWVSRTGHTACEHRREYDQIVDAAEWTHANCKSAQFVEERTKERDDARALLGLLDAALQGGASLHPASELSLALHGFVMSELTGPDEGHE